MSLRLGPIHNWLYNQIQLIEDREVKIIDAFKNKYDSNEIDAIVSPLRDKFGQLKGETPLEEMIGDSHIHPWLETAITAAQTREAAVVKELMDRYDDQDLLDDVYQKHAEELANKVSQGKSDDLETAFKLLKDSLLERMPCDRLSAVVKEEANEIVWKHNIRLHTEFWKEAGASIELMHQLYSSWIESFMTAINSDIKHQRQIEDDYYQDTFTL